MQNTAPQGGGAVLLAGGQAEPIQNTDSTQPAALSVITSRDRCTKLFRKDRDGSIERINGGEIAAGEILVRKVAAVGDLAFLIASLTPKQALTYGEPINGAKRLMTRKAYAKAGKPKDATPRTNDAFRWPNGPGVMMLDYDVPAGATPLGRDDLIEVITDAAPGLSLSSYVWMPSASSCIYDGETEVHGIRGQRIYFLVLDAADIPRAGAALADRLWLAGQGRIEISKSGQMLERCPIDTSVWQPSRLDFASGAECCDGIEQRRGEPFAYAGAIEFTDTREAIPDLTADERAEAARFKREAKAEAKPESEAIRENWIEERAEAMGGGDPEALEQARSVARRALDAGVLSGDFPLEVEIDGKWQTVAVGVVLDHRERFHNLLTRDPLEPDYDGGRAVGRLFTMQARPSLYSFAHGGKTYRLERAPARIELVKGHTSEAVNETIEKLRRDPITFDFGGQLAIAESGRVHPLCDAGLAHHLAGITQYWKYVMRGEAMVPQDADAPPALLKQILALGERRALKPLDGVITAPTIRTDGSVLDAPGYDERTRLLFDPMGAEVPAIPLSPAIEQARAALDTLLQPFQTFPFVDALAKGAMLAAILTAVVRQVLPTAPAIAFDAPIQGAGKTLLAVATSAITLGTAPDVWPHTQGRDDEETRKRLFTALRTGSKAIVWDNVTGTFDSASMAAFITAPAMIDRVLGKSEAIRIPNRALLILTGNNLSLAGDLPRRVLICRIDPETDQPFARQFDLDPLQWVIDNRIDMVAAACTLIRGRFTHLKEPAPGRLASFEQWDDLVRQTVVWADRDLMPGAFGDPMDLIREAQAADPEAEVLFALLDALQDAFGLGEFTAKDILSRVNADCGTGALHDALIDIAGDRAVASSKSLGRVLANRKGRIVHGLSLLHRKDTNTGSHHYRIKQAENGFNGYNGFVSSHTENSQTDSKYEGRESNPSNPLNPHSGIDRSFWGDVLD